MLLWLAISLMTGAAIMAVLWPLRSRAGEGVSDGQADLAVYRDQLAEIERDRASGLIGAAESEAARTEVARRMIRVAEADGAGPVAASGDRRRRVAAMVALVGVPLFAGGLYFALGSPGIGGQPLSARLDARPDQADVAILVRRVETHLEANPDDARGYEVIAPIYMRLARFEDAARAWQNAIRLDGSTATRQIGLGDALMAQSGGVVTAEAKAAFEAAHAADAGDPKARYFLGLAAEQDGKPQEAAAIWSALAADTPADAPWRPVLAAALTRVGVAAMPAPGPGAAPPELSPQSRNAMIRGMVDGLAERLAKDGNDLDGWLRLMRSWSVLGEGAKARDAVSKARMQFASDSDALGRIDALARELGLGS